jgi:hypothetical protein
LGYYSLYAVGRGMDFSTRFFSVSSVPSVYSVVKRMNQ